MGVLNRHRLWQVAVDAVLVGIAWYATYEVGFQIERNPGWDAYWKQTILIVIAIKFVCLAAFGAYNKWWRYASLPDIMALLRAIGIASIVLLIGLSIVKFPRGVIVHPEASKGQQKQLKAVDCDPRGRALRDAAQEGRDRQEPAAPPGARARGVQARAGARPGLHADPAGRRARAGPLADRAPAPRLVRRPGQEGADRRRR